MDITTDLITAWNFFSRSQDCSEEFSSLCDNVAQLRESEIKCRSLLGNSMSICIDRIGLKSKWRYECLKFLDEFEQECDAEGDDNLLASTSRAFFYWGLFTVIPVFMPLVARMFLNIAMLPRCFKLKDYRIVTIRGRLIRWKGNLQKIAWNFPLFQPIRFFLTFN